jgi:hypothetical protein
MDFKSFFIVLSFVARQRHPFSNSLVGPISFKKKYDTSILTFKVLKKGNVEVFVSNSVFMNPFQQHDV